MAKNIGTLGKYDQRRLKIKLQGPPAGKLQKIFESQSQKTLKKLSNSPNITTCCLGGF